MDHVAIPLDHVTGIDIFTQKWEMMVEVIMNANEISGIVGQPRYMFSNGGAERRWSKGIAEVRSSKVALPQHQGAS